MKVRPSSCSTNICNEEGSWRGADLTVQAAAGGITVTSTESNSALLHKKHNKWMKNLPSVLLLWLHCVWTTEKRKARYIKQAGSGRPEMAFWVTQPGCAICRVNWWKRIEKEVETNDDGLAMIVPHPFFASNRHLSPPRSLKSKLHCHNASRHRNVFLRARLFFFNFFFFLNKPLFICRQNTLFSCYVLLKYYLEYVVWNLCQMPPLGAFFFWME